MLGIEHRGVPRAHPKEASIEQIDIGQAPARSYVGWVAENIWRNPRGKQLLIR